MNGERILIAGGRIVDPASGHDAVGDVAIAAGRIVALGAAADFEPQRRIDARGLIVAPGLVDLAVRLREPGHEHEGMLASELAAALAGGVTALACLPDTDPPLDEPGLVEMLQWRAGRRAGPRVWPLGALTRGLKGEVLTEMAQLAEAGCIGFAQAEASVVDTGVLLRALQYAATFGYAVWLRPQDAWLGRGVAASGALATRLGLSGIPVAAETIALHTVFELVRATGARVHLCRLSSAAAVALMRAAKAEGLPVSCDISINHLHLSDDAIGYFDPATRLVPPLRQARDRDALRSGLADGTIDALVSDHAPVDPDAKNLPFAQAEPGATGVELLLGAALAWGAEQGLDPLRTLARVTSAPAALAGAAGRDAGRLAVGAAADVCVFDPQARWRVEPQALRSQGKHTPFAGHELPGRVRCTLVAGRVAYDCAASR